MSTHWKTYRIARDSCVVICWFCLAYIQYSSKECNYSWILLRINELGLHLLLCWIYDFQVCRQRKCIWSNIYRYFCSELRLYLCSVWSQVCPLCKMKYIQCNLSEGWVDGLKVRDRVNVEINQPWLSIIYRGGCMVSNWISNIMMNLLHYCFCSLSW